MATRRHEHLDVPAAHDEVFAALRKQVDDFLGEVQEMQKGLLDAPWQRGFGVVPHRGGVQLRPFGSMLDRDALSRGWREPFMRHELDEEAEMLRVWAEVPGVAREAIRLDVGPDHIRLEARGDESRYRAFLEPGMSLDPDHVEASCRDGVLRIEVPLRADEAKRVRHIKVG